MKPEAMCVLPGHRVILSLLLCAATASTLKIPFLRGPLEVRQANKTSKIAVASGSSALPVLKSQHGSQHNRSEYKLTREPRVYFLFLAVDKVSNLDIWTAFFETAPPDQYRAFVHCKTDQCKQQVAGSPLRAVTTVPTYYCTDLVSAMNQLVATALQEDPASGSSVQDMFTYISDSSVPAKPFSIVYSQLTSRRGSSFCLFPVAEWADVTSLRGREFAPKASQWLTLDRAAAEKTYTLWVSGHWHNLMPHFQMNYQAYTGNNNTFRDNRNFGCLDEYWHMVALYQPISELDPNYGKEVNLHGFVGSPLRLSASEGYQGQCDTFVMWQKYSRSTGPGLSSPFPTFYDNLDPQSIPHSGNSARPGWWDHMTRNGMMAIRRSEFLFVRKWIDQPTLVGGGNFASAYNSLVLH